MEPEFIASACIIVDPDRAPVNGSYVVATFNGSKEATFKKLVIDGPNKYLKPLNPRYPIIEASGDMQVCGVVISQSKHYI